MPWLQEGGQVRLVGSASMDGFVKRTSSWFFLSTPRLRMFRSKGDSITEQRKLLNDDCREFFLSSNFVELLNDDEMRGV